MKVESGDRSFYFKFDIGVGDSLPLTVQNTVQSHANWRLGAGCCHRKYVLVVRKPALSVSRKCRMVQDESKSPATFH